MVGGSGAARRRAQVALVVVLLAGVAAGVAQAPGALPVLLAGAVLAADGVLLATRRDRRAGATAGEGELDVVPVLAVGWLALLLFGIHDFSGRSTEAALTRFGAQPAVELLLFAAVAAAAASVVVTLRAAPVVAGPLALLPVLVVLSAAWADAPAYAVVRGAQYVALAVLAAATVAVGRAEPDALVELLRRLLRGFVVVVASLVVLGILFGKRLVVVAPGNVDRFGWVGGHPTAAGTLTAGALVVLLAGGPRWLGLGRAATAVAGGLLAYGLLASQTRAALAAFAVSVGALVVLRRRGRAGGAPVLPAVVVAGAAAVLLAGDRLGAYVLRGGDTDQLTSLNGRAQLWGIGLDALRSPFDWVFGRGYGATRTVFVEQVSWAGNAHNSLLGLLVGLGLVGVVVVVLAVGSAFASVVRGGLLDRPHGRAATCLLLQVLVLGAATDELAEPAYGTVVLFLVTAVGGAALGGARPAPPGVRAARRAPGAPLAPR